MTDLYIKNNDQILSPELNKSQLDRRKIALNAIERAITSVMPKNLMKNHLKIEEGHLKVDHDRFDLNKYNQIYIIGGGKATAEMGVTLSEIFESAHIGNYQGIVNIPETQDLPDISQNEKIKFNRASHPLPSEGGLKGTREMMKLVEKASKNDLIICLVSGGGSALLPLPRKHVSLRDLMAVNSLLLASGASIHEINAIRKHLSDFKGGNVAKKSYNTGGSTLISLIISDVVGDDLETIASGPTVPDQTTFEDAQKILIKYDIYNKIPPSVKQVIEMGVKNPELENPKIMSKVFNNVHNYLIGSIIAAIKKVNDFLEGYEFLVKIFSNNIEGEARDFAFEVLKLITSELDFYDYTSDVKRIALLGTGELTVKIKGEGVGGRNQEFLLSFLNLIKEKPINHEFTMIGVNLDGIEGNSDAMGALVDNQVYQMMLKEDLNPESFLNNNDSNTFFKSIGTEIITGPTGANVNDLVLILLEFNQKAKIHYYSKDDIYLM